jgi:hypothetical protein
MRPRSICLTLSLSAALTAALAGCTFESGDWFATVTPSFQAAYVARADRDAGGGWQRLSSDYQVKVTNARLELSEIALLAATGGKSTSFDPAHPPPGYTLCHNGHCHSTDGRLVPYAEIEAELAGGGSSSGLQAAMTLPVDGTLDLLAPAPRSLSCKPSCHLDQVTVLRASAPITTLVLEGLVRDGRMPGRFPGEMPFHWQVSSAIDAGSATPPPLEREMNLPADRDHAPQVRLDLRVELDATLFDGIDFSGPPEAAEARLLANLKAGKYLLATASR